MTGKKNFYFRGCGWPNKTVSWCADDKLWITAMNQLFESLYGKDTLKYIYVPGRGTKVQDCDNPMPVFCYDHKVWEENYASYVTAIKSEVSKPVKSLKPELDTWPLQSQKMSTLSLDSGNVTDLPGTSVTGNIPSPSLDPGNVTPLRGTPFSSISDNTMPSNRGSHMPGTPTSSNSTVTMPGSGVPPRASSVFQADLTSSDQSQMTYHLDAWLTALAGLTRKNLSNIAVPPPAAGPSCSSRITVAFGAYIERNPLSIKERPAEGLISEAEKAFRSDPHSHQRPTGVVIGNLGTFSRDGVSVLRKFCEISSLRLSILSEERWLTENHDGLSVDEISCIGEVLWNRRTSESILRAGRKSLDVLSFSTLVGERYLDNFVIDVTIWHYLQDCQVHSKALYLPSETHTWLETNNCQFIRRKLEELMASTREEELELILCPLHMNESHWGLIVMDLLNRRLWCDDGYKLQPDTHVLPNIKNVLDIFRQLRPGALCFGNTFWDSIQQFERFGMPSQHGCARAGQGTGSCGVGVILAARDFLSKGVAGAVHQFGWTYTEMRHLRKQLMIQILKWGCS